MTEVAIQLLGRFSVTVDGAPISGDRGRSRRAADVLKLLALFWRIVGWLRKRHVGLNMHTLVRRFFPHWEVRAGGIEMFRPRALAIERYRYRGTKIPTPWSSAPTPRTSAPAA